MNIHLEKTISFLASASTEMLFEGTCHLDAHVKKFQKENPETSAWVCAQAILALNGVANPLFVVSYTPQDPSS